MPGLTDSGGQTMKPRYTVKDQLIYRDGMIITPSEIVDLLNAYEQALEEEDDGVDCLQIFYDGVIRA